MPINNPKNKQDEFMELYQPVHDRLNRFVNTIVWNREDARDVIAETVLKAYENFEQLRAKEAFLYYLFGIASNISKRRLRRMKFWGTFNPEYAEQLADQSARTDDKSSITELKIAIENLPHEQKEAITLYEISGFSMEEIQQIQGGTLSGVKSRIARARQKLAKMLEKDFEINDQPIFTHDKKVSSVH
ncbi:MAG: hypothetical protein RIQ89_1174 [Bacteroidota bacterium]|jgi:RNA polymerase sigma-70 factor, ECF subfamily